MAHAHCTQLEKLSREHQDSLAFADTIAELAATGTEEALAEGLRRVRQYYTEELEGHLQHEERTIFGPLMQYDRAHFSLCVRLGTEHGLFRTLIPEMRRETAQQDLTEFARVLRAHTVAEEEELLPLVESLFTAEQLDAIANFTPQPLP